MKKSLLALAVLGVFAGAASAQSSVTIYGYLDVAVGKRVGSTDKEVMDTGGTGGSRLGFRGVEDLGGGLSALFGFEHRFDPSDGAVPAGQAFWHGYSTVGLKGAFGTVNLGRQYTATFSLIQNQIDPFAGDGQASVRDVGMRPRTTYITSTTGALLSASIVSRVRTPDSIRYDFSGGGFNFAATLGESLTNGPGTDKAYSIAANYAAGPLFLGAGFENPSGQDDQVWSVGGRYNFGFATLSAGYSGGSDNADRDNKGYVIGVIVPIGAGDLKFGYGHGEAEQADGSDGDLKKFGLGYQYNLSKRTRLYADFGRVSGQLARGPKNGYDIGIRHSF